MKLGRLPHDPALLAECPKHVFGAVTAPPVVDRRSIDYQPGLYGNSEYNDCCFASVANAARGVAKTHGYSLAVADEKPLADFAEYNGDPPDLATIEGCLMQDVSDWQEASGLDLGGPVRLYGVPRVIDHTSRNDLALSIFQLGHGWWGIDIYEKDIADIQAGRPWDFTLGQDSGKLLGGHAINAWDYTGLQDTDMVRVGTWGRWQPATWNWISRRLLESHAVIWPQLKAAPL